MSKNLQKAFAAMRHLAEGLCLDAVFMVKAKNYLIVL
jgi:hypothetical protein